jgi:uncharacterized protein
MLKMLFEQAGQFILDKLGRELPANIYYHNAEHTKDVHAAAQMIGQGEHITDHEMKLLLTAAWFHDSGFLETSKGHEVISCRIAQEALPGFGYNADEIEKICGMIMATRLPQSPKNHLEQILADADLDYLGRDDFFTIGNRIYKEWAIGDRKEWDAIQLKFLCGHHYFTKTALNLRDVKKKQNLAQVRSQLQ